jgi:hypothetical protein
MVWPTQAHQLPDAAGPQAHQLPDAAVARVAQMLAPTLCKRSDKQPLDEVNADAAVLLRLTAERSSLGSMRLACKAWQSCAAAAVQQLDRWLPLERALAPPGCWRQLSSISAAVPHKRLLDEGEDPLEVQSGLEGRLRQLYSGSDLQVRGRRQATRVEPAPCQAREPHISTSSPAGRQHAVVVELRCHLGCSLGPSGALASVAQQHWTELRYKPRSHA